MNKNYARMRKGSFILLMFAALLVTASVTKKDPEPKVFKIKQPDPTRLSDHEAPAEKLPDYAEFKQQREVVVRQIDSMKAVNKKYNDSIEKGKRVQLAIATTE